MYRCAMEQLNKWKQKSNRKPLIIEGARQVGKTWLMKEFAKTFDDMIYINFDNNSQMKNLFESDLEISRIISGLELYCGKKINPKSLKSYNEKFSPAISVRTAMTDYKKEEWLINLPLYAIGQINEICI